MALRIGRSYGLSTPQVVPYEFRAPEHASVGGLEREKAYGIQGREAGASAQASMTSLEKDSVRQGDVYVADDAASVPSGYYRVESFRYDKPKGAPSRRPFTAQLVAKAYPFVVRQAEDDKVLGVNQGGGGVYDLDEDAETLYTATSTPAVAVLDPRNVANAEPLNLPAGYYKAVVSARNPGLAANVLLQLVVTDLAGTAVVTGGEVTLPATTADVQDVQLMQGASPWFQVPAANAGANWYVLKVRCVAGFGTTAAFDRVRFLRIPKPV